MPPDTVRILRDRLLKLSPEARKRVMKAAKASRDVQKFKAEMRAKTDQMNDPLQEASETSG